MGIFDFFKRKNNPLDWNDKGIETKKVDEVDILTYNDEPYTGIILSRYKNGKIEQLDNFFEGLREGNCEKYFSNGELDYVAEYKDGKNWGSTKFYNKSEKYLEEEHFYENGKLIESKSYYNTGDIKNLTTYNNGVKHQSKDFDKNKNLVGEELYTKDKDKSSYTLYHNNGNISQKGTKINGKFEGVVESYTEDGILDQSCNYYNGKKNGDFFFYYPDGSIEVHSRYLNGKKNGLSKSFYSNRNIKNIVNFKLGLKDGKATYFHENGKLSAEANFKSDLLLEEVKLYNTEGDFVGTQDWDFAENFIMDEEKYTQLIQYFLEHSQIDLDKEYYFSLVHEKANFLKNDKQIFSAWEVIIEVYKNKDKSDFITNLYPNLVLGECRQPKMNGVQTYKSCIIAETPNYDNTVLTGSTTRACEGSMKDIAKILSSYDKIHYESLNEGDKESFIYFEPMI